MNSQVVFTPPKLVPRKPSDQSDTVPVETPIIPLARVNSTLTKNYQGFDYMLAQFVEQTHISEIETTPEYKEYPQSDFTETLTISDPSKKNTFIPPRLLPKKSFADQSLDNQLDPVPSITVTFAPPRLLSKPSFVRQPSSLRNTYDESKEQKTEKVDLFESEIVKKSPNVTDLNLFEKEISLNRIKSLSKSPLNLFEKEISLQRIRSIKSPSELSSEISLRRSISISSRKSLDLDKEAKLFNYSPSDITEVKAYWQISDEYHGI
ncbi:hypothetical protein HDV06_001992 [Boothiomyces sp. JEL0866]|nr:hypothetical protein HDV06_001992 [Boothiomyces sp. JEL0866]